ncbi:MAG: hypothetical protein KKG04_08235 [Candidatus Thermoplasmatota archaeon]|nr:hypothetical protein [Candidatus Thermoplasmatota archaeon]
MRTQSIKWFAIVGVILFLGMTVAPAIHADVIDYKNNLITYTTSMYVNDGIHSQKIALTQEQSNELEHLFDTLQNQLNQSKSQKKSQTILTRALDAFEQYGLLTTQQKAQMKQLLNNYYRTLKYFHIFSKNNPQPTGRFSIRENFQCLLVGAANGIELDYANYPLPILTFMSKLIGNIWDLIPEDEYIGIQTLLFLGAISLLFTAFFRGLFLVKISPFVMAPINMTFGAYEAFHNWDTGLDEVTKYGSTGWVYTTGLNGTFQYLGYMYGNLGRDVWEDSFDYYRYGYIGVTGFIGFKIFRELNRRPTFFYGYADHVRLKPKSIFG